MHVRDGAGILVKCDHSVVRLFDVTCLHFSLKGCLPLIASLQMNPRFGVMEFRNSVAPARLCSGPSIEVPTVGITALVEIE